MAARRGLTLAADGQQMSAPAPAADSRSGATEPASQIPPAWHEAQAVLLWPGAPPGGGFAPAPPPADFPATFLTNIAAPEMRVFRSAHPNRRALLIMPGGAYRFLSIRNEGSDIAEAFTALGYTVFVLCYRLPGEGWLARADVPLADARRAMRLIRRDAASYGIDPAQVAAIGFSAGGHLAAMLLTGGDDANDAVFDDCRHIPARPACGALVYPVISLEPPLTHQLSAETLLGPDPAPGVVARHSPARRVSDETPPLFMVHARDDEAVPWMNTQLMVDALRGAGRPFEVHLVEQGGHGFGLGPEDTPAREWPALLARWLDRAFG